jgi:hypothetical protein
MIKIFQISNLLDSVIKLISDFIIIYELVDFVSIIPL